MSWALHAFALVGILIWARRAHWWDFAVFASLGLIAVIVGGTWFDRILIFGYGVWCAASWPSFWAHTKTWAER